MIRQLFASLLLTSLTIAAAQAQTIPDSRPSPPNLPVTAVLPSPTPPRFDPPTVKQSTYITPTVGILSSGYGWRWGRMHKGIDLAAPLETPVMAAADGTITHAGWNSGGYGNLIDIKHRDGSMTRYAHLNQIFVRSGDTVKQGEIIGEIGSTGWSTGPHLHFELHLPTGETVNPIAYLPQNQGL